MRLSHRITAAAALGSAAVLAALAASLGANERGAPVAPVVDSDDPAVFVRAFYTRVLSGDPAVCPVFTGEGRRDFVADMEPAQDCREAVEILGNAVGADHLDEFTSTHTYVLVSRDAHEAVVRADFGATADLMTLHWVEGQWRVGATTPTTPPPSSE